MPDQNTSTTTRRLLTPAQAFVEYGTPLVTLAKWAKHSCPRLGRLLRTVPDPKHRGWRLYDSDDLKTASANDGERVEEFKNAKGEWIWVQKAAKDFGLGIDTVRDWQTVGCPALEDKKIAEETRWFKGHFNPLYFVRKQDIEKAIAVRAGTTGLSGNQWRTKKELWEEHRYDRHTLMKYSRQKHPVLGRPIRTQKRWVTFAESGKFETLFSAADIAEIETRLNKNGNRTDLVSPIQTRRYNFSPGNITRWRKAGCPHLGGKKLLGERMIVRSKNRMVKAEWWHNKSQLDEIKKVIASPREYKDSHGLWLPLREAAKRVGVIPEMIVTWGKNPCPLIERTIKRQRIPVVFHRSNQRKETWVYLAADLDLVKARKNGLPDPKAPTAATIQKPKRGIQISAKEIKMRNDCLDRWATASSQMTLKTFVADPILNPTNVSIETIRKWMAWRSVNIKRGRKSC